MGVEILIDARGLSCPVPQMKAIEAIESVDESTIEVLVDEEAARDSIVRTARAFGLPYRVERGQAEFKVIISKEKKCSAR